MVISKMKSEPERSIIFWKNVILSAGSLFFLLPNLYYSAMSWFVRHRADDFCFSGTLREFGLLGGLVEFYSSISNRFSAFLVWSFSDLFGQNAIRFFPIMAIIFLGISIYYLSINTFKHVENKNKKFLAFFVSQVLVFFILYLSPDIHQSVYWRAAMVHYFLPFPALLLLVWHGIRHPAGLKTTILKPALYFLASFFLAGLSESFAALLGGTFALVLVYWIFSVEKKKYQHLMIISIASITGTVAALLVMIISPGNALKFATVEQAPDLFSIVKISISSSFDFIYFSIRGLWLPFCILFTLGFLLAASFRLQGQPGQANRKLMVAGILIPFVTFFLIAGICAPTAYGMKAYPEKRVLMLASMLVVLAIFSLGVISGSLLKPLVSRVKAANMLTAAAIAILSVYPLLSIPKLIGLVELYRARANLWDGQYAEIMEQKAMGASDLVVTSVGRAFGNRRDAGIRHFLGQPLYRPVLQCRYDSCC